MTFSGNGVVGNSIANGVYDITLNSADVSSDANPSVNVQAASHRHVLPPLRRHQRGRRGERADNFQFKTAISVYNAAFDYNDDGVGERGGQLPN